MMNMTIASLHDAYCSKDLTPEALVDKILEQCEQYSGHNIWITLLDKSQIMEYVKALADKPKDESPLWGIPFAVKDNIDLGGVPTTAGCPEFSFVPEKNAFVVEQFIAAGAIPIGKTNLDQFATGLVGTRSPYGECKNSFDPNMVSGGSSSGSAIAVALGLVTFSLGTDTAGSGRVPAAFNNLIGTKPSCGLLSTRGVLPACRSLDCVTFFTTTQHDANTLLKIGAVYDEHDIYARESTFSKGLAGETFKIGVPKEDQLEFFGHDEYPTLFKQACEQLKSAGAELVPVDIEPMLAAAKFLYYGPWVAERYHAVGEFLDQDPEGADLTVAAIIKGGKSQTAVEAFDGLYKLKAFKKLADKILAGVDCIVTPTTSNHYSIEEMNGNPVELNNNLGYYTNFMNLLDYSALAIPAGFTTEGLPFGITLFADAFADQFLQGVSEQYLSVKNWGLGATGLPMPLEKIDKYIPEGYIPVAVCGAHLTGMPLNSQLQDRQAQLIESTTTAPYYEFYALAGGPPYRPGLKRKQDAGDEIFVEVWAVPAQHFGSFVAGIPAPLGIGKLELADGRWVPGFICEPYGMDDAEDITKMKDWRTYMALLAE